MRNSILVFTFSDLDRFLSVLSKNSIWYFNVTRLIRLILMLPGQWNSVFKYKKVTSYTLSLETNRRLQ